MGSYPECERVAAAKDKSLVLTDFVDWLGEKGIVLAGWRKFGIFEEDQLSPIRQSYEELFADFFNIDLKKVEAEKVAMLAALRNARD